ncbi:MAG TPA: lantibiotic dehydratase [Ktedonobacteraceae bacterium]
MVFTDEYTWQFLPHYVIRSTGFPFQWLESLSFPETTVLIERVLEAEHALQEWEARLGRLWEADTELAWPRKVKQQLRKWIVRREGGICQRLPLLPESLRSVAEEWAAGWDARVTAYYASLEAHNQAFERELPTKRAQLRRLVADPRYQEAIFLSSPDMYHHHIHKYLDQQDGSRRTSELKRVEKRFFKYLQRLCGKNETSSFFGPLNYGRIDPARKHFLDERRSAGPLIQYRQVFLAFWMVKALAEAIRRDERLQDELPVSLHPMVEIRDGGSLYLHSGDRVFAVGQSLARILQALDGSQSLPQFLASLPAEEQPRAERLLQALLQAGIVRRGFVVPSTVARPMEHVVAQLHRLPDSPARQEWEQRLAMWNHWCEEMTAADLPTRIRLLEQGEARFTEQTGEPAQRGSGNLYADRYIFYEEARGHVEQFVMGRAFYEKMRRDLRGALELSAFQGHHEWKHLQKLGHELFRELSPAGHPVPFFRFLNALRERYPAFPDIPPLPEQEEIRSLIAGKVEQGEIHRVSLSSQELPIIEQKTACYSLPDLFFASTSIEAMQRGEFQIVLGKLHHHLLVPNWMTCFYGDKAGLAADLRSYLEHVPAFQQLVCPEVIRRNKGFYDFPGRMVEFSERSLKSREEVVPLYDIQVVEQADGTLGLERISSGEPMIFYISLADQVRYLPFALFALPALSQVSFSLGTHTPRIEIDGAVYQRERWEVPSNEWMGLLNGDELENFTSLHRLKQTYELPDLVYVRGSSERKPYVLDFRNFFCLELLHSIMEKNDSLLIEEMLPAPDQLWLKNSQGRYSCEFRMNVFKIRNHAERETDNDHRSH